MLKKFLVMFIVIFSALFLLNFEKVEAYSTDVGYSLANYNSTKESQDCKSIFGDPDQDGSVANFLQQIFTIIGYTAPLLCLVLSISDFIKAAASQDKDALMKAVKRTFKRVIYAIVLFFLPLLINFLFPLLGWYGTCGIK